MEVSTKTEANREVSGVFAKCPECGQKLFESRVVHGYAYLVCMCRRCKRYVCVELTGR